MAQMKKAAPKRVTSSRTPSKSVKKPLAKKVKVEGPSNYTPNTSYKLPMTPKQSIAFGKLKMSPKTADTLFTTPKGTTGMSQKEIDQMQARRITDRKRTLARAESIIRRTVGTPKIGGVNRSEPTSKPKKPKQSKPKSTFGY
jgi:hypothetical protein